MIIKAPCVVTLTWRLEDAQGELIDELDEPLEFYYGGDDLLAGVEQVLEGKDIGFAERVQLEPEQAFGAYEPGLVCFEPRELFPADIEAGMQVEGLPEGHITPHMPLDAVYTVTDVYDDHVVLDGNHPLAGMALRLALQVRDVRAATPDEIAQGTVGSDTLSVLGTGSPSPHLH